MTERDPLVLSFSHLNDEPGEKEALHTLKKLASLVKPIMRARSWRVKELAEFYPDQKELLGLNINKGQRILIRLRHPFDKKRFLPFEQVLDTLLHELAHIVWGPHNDEFHALWNQLRDEHEGLKRKGYTGEGFLSEGRRLGGRGPIPMHEARRLARAEAERRRQQTLKSSLHRGAGHRLGGSAPVPGQDMRQVIAAAANRRNTALQGCGNVKHNDQEIRTIAETATRNGFRTQAEEDAANDAAIAQALWELVQEEERSVHGGAYIPPSAAQPAGNGGGTFIPNDLAGPRPSASGSGSGISTVGGQSRGFAGGWSCEACTLNNPDIKLCCELCGTQRSEDVSLRIALEASVRPEPAFVDLTNET